MREASEQDLAEFEGFAERASSLLEESDAPASAGFTSTPSPLSQDSIYAGDATDDDGPAKDGKWQTLNLPSPSFLITLVNKAFREGIEELYDWQKEQLQEIAESNSVATLHNPYKLALCAANGSGKDYIIVSPTVVWMSLVNIRCLTIITSSSGVQLTSQTEGYIKSLCEAVNEYCGFPVFKIRQRFIKCLLSGSEIRLFATDEEGKAEGYHPLEPRAKMGIWVNEAKSVDEGIFRALKRCTGYTHWFNVSTPGEPKGSFHRACTQPILGFRHRKITYRECRTATKTHISEMERIADEIELGATSALYRSKWLAEFTSIDIDCIITLDQVNLCIDDKVKAARQDEPLKIGMDLSAGGDETTLVARRGNKIVKEIAFRERDTTVVAARLDQELIALGVSKDHEWIFADDGGIGKSIIDMLRKRRSATVPGWSVRRVVNQARAIRPDQNGNRGAELWYTVKRLIEERTQRLDEASELLRQQLYTRRYEKRNGKIWLEPKPKAKAEGNPSPDRADAYVLTFCGESVADWIGIAAAEVTKSESIPKAQGMKLATIDELTAAVDEIAFGEFESPHPAHRGGGRRVYNSLTTAMAGTDKRHLPYATN